ncbi:hypothetical protein CEXT_185791 [Caerostris extrusa]|uniref:Uncharacterized protein n=1 Tax=Caerostris extrusa TaxID=172846 RepID=A0AAV4XL31_CAEEX|nr:hypothetical protein CEXT_185791 [Caerostris extrusa]
MDWQFLAIWIGHSHIGELGVLDSFISPHVHLIYRFLISFCRGNHKTIVYHDPVESEMDLVSRLNCTDVKLKKLLAYLIVSDRHAWRMMMQTSSICCY